MFHKLAGGLEVAVANSAERSQGLFGNLGKGGQAKWVAGSDPRCSQAVPSETSPPTYRPPHLSSAGCALPPYQNTGNASPPYALAPRWDGRWRQKQEREDKDNHQEEPHEPRD